jgi:hypothetical protein
MLQLNRLHGVIPQKMILFITTAVKTSNPIKFQSFSDEDIGNVDMHRAGVGKIKFSSGKGPRKFSIQYAPMFGYD